MKELTTRQCHSFLTPFYIPSRLYPFLIWHRALALITEVDPVPASDRGNIETAAKVWLTA